MKKGIVLVFVLMGVFYGSSQSTGKYQIKFLEVNKDNSDYGVAILDDNKLIFTSALEKANGNNKNYNPRKELYVGDINFDGEITNVKPIMPNADDSFNKTGASYSLDEKTVYFSTNKYIKKLSKQNLPKNQRLELFKASVDQNGKWINIKKLSFNDEKYSTGYPVLNKDNTKLYFVSDRLPSEGKTDIFVVDIFDDGSYSSPKNLGKNVNTNGTETTPFITDDGILYFSSDGHPGKGKLDVFAVETYGDTTSEVYQLASPINSINDDFAYIVNKENSQGFFTSNRLQGQGFNDLYAFTLEKDIRPGKCFISVDGKVKDKETQEVISGATVDLYNMEGALLESVSTFADGTYKFTVSCAKEYKLIASNVTYENDEKRIEILEENYHSALHTNLNLNKIREKKPVVESLQPIFYEFDEAIITTRAAQEMDKIVTIMKENPNLSIEASSYTDSRGTNAYNIVLSQKRAKATVKYLTSHGINAKRIKSKGFGEEKLKNHCIDGVDCDESAHQMNRRTEFNFMNAQANTQSKKPDKQVAQIEPKKATAEKKAPEKKEKENSPPKQVTKAKSTNKATNYIEDQKVKIISNLSELEKKYDVALTDNSIVKDSIFTQKTKIIEYKKIIKESQETGWTNIIEYKNNLKTFNKRYQELLNENKKVTSSQNQEGAKKDVSVTSPKEILKEEQNKTSFITNEVIEKPVDDIFSKTKSSKKTDIHENIVKNESSENLTKANEKEKSTKTLNEEIIINYKSSIVAVDKKNNKALNYIENEKLNVIDQIIDLEKKFDLAINEYVNAAVDLKTEKDNVVDLRMKVENLEETGWSDIISYKNKLIELRNKYNDILGESSQSRIAEINSNENDYALSEIDVKDKEILEENLRINNIEVTALKVNSNGKYQKTSNAKKTDLIKVKFKLLHNDNVASGQKDAHIILQDPNGKVTEAKGIFTLKDSNVSKKYTDHTVIDYNKNDIDITMYIKRNFAIFEKGIYPVKFFLEGQLVAVSNLDLASAF